MALQDDVEKSDGSRSGQRPGSAAASAAIGGTPLAALVGAIARPSVAMRAGSAVDTEVPIGASDGIGDSGPDSSDLDATFRHSYSRDQAILVRRLRRIEGQVRGIERMIERREYCIDILQQTAALRAAVDSVALLILEDHVQGCVRTAAEQGNPDRYIEEVLDVVRRTLGKPVRNPRV